MAEGFRQQAGFNLTKNRLQLVEIALSGGERLVQNISEVFFEDPLTFDESKKTKFLSQLQSGFDELCISQPLGSKFVNFSLPLDLFKIIQLPLESELSYPDAVEQFRWELKVLYPEVDETDLAVQFFPIDPNFAYKHTSAIVIAIPRYYLKIISQFAEQNDIELRFIENSHFASDRILFGNGSLDSGLTLSVYYSNLHITAEVFEDGELIMLRSGKLQNIGKIIDFLEEQIFIKAGLNRHSFKASYFNSDNISSSALQKLEAGLLLKFNRYNTFENLIFNSDTGLSKSINFQGPGFASAAGIAMRYE